MYIYRPSKPLDKPLDKPLVVFMNPFGCHQSMCVCLMPIAIVLGIPTKHDIIGIDVPILFGLPFFMGWMTINIHKPKRTISWHGPNPWMAHLFQSMAHPWPSPPRPRIQVGHYAAVQAVDYNGDGLVDVIAGNQEHEQKHRWDVWRSGWSHILRLDNIGDLW